MPSVRNVRAGGATVEVDADLNPLQRQLRSAQSRLKSFSRFAARLALPAVGATTALATTGAAFVRAASIVEEGASRFRAVFGGLEADARSFANTLADSIGRSTTEVADQLATFGSVFAGLGFSGGQSLALAKRVVGLGIDLASFANTSDADALQRVQSALAGSSEAVDRFGLNLRASAVSAELLALGIGTTNANASESEKVLARLSLIQKGLARQGAIGDAARTSGQFANSLKRLKGEAFDAAAALGGALLPAVTPVVRGLAAAAEFVGTWAAENRTLVTTLALAAGAVAALTVGVVALGAASAVASAAMGGLAAVAGVVSGPVVLGGLAIAAVGAAIVLNWDRVSGIVGGGLRALREAGLAAEFVFTRLAAVADLALSSMALGVVQFGANIQHVFGEVLPAWGRFAATALREVAVNIATNLFNLVGEIRSFLQGDGFNFVWTGLLDGFARTMAQLPVVADREIGPLERFLAARVSQGVGGLAADFTTFRLAAQGGSPVEDPDGFADAARGASGLADLFDELVASARGGLDGIEVSRASPRGGFNPARAAQAFGVSNVWGDIRAATQHIDQSANDIRRTLRKIEDRGGLVVS